MDMIAVPGCKVWFKRVGSGAGLPLLVVHGGPGLPHYYLSSLERLADEREVIFWDQLGCGESDRPSDTGLWTMRRSVAEMAAVVEAMGLGAFHLFGNSWGAMIAQQYVLDVSSGAASFVISNSAASMPAFAANVIRLKSELDAGIQDAIDRDEAAGATAWNQKHMCRELPWPAYLHRAFQDMGTEIFETMFGPSIFRIVGTVRDWDVVDRLGEIEIPTLLLSGRYDECSPQHMRDMHERIEGSRFEFFENSAHLPFIEEPDRFDVVLREFLRLHD